MAYLEQSGTSSEAFIEQVCKVLGIEPGSDQHHYHRAILRQRAGSGGASAPGTAADPAATRRGCECHEFMTQPLACRAVQSRHHPPEEERAGLG